MFPDIASSSNNLESFIIKTAVPLAQKLDKILHPEWIAGFATGESNFFISVPRQAVPQKSKNKSGFTTTLRFSIAQHSRDLLLLENLIEYFAGGYIMSYKNRPLCEFIITKIDIILEKVIPFFDKYPVAGSKHLDFLNFKSAAHIIKNKEHLRALPEEG